VKWSDSTRYSSRLKALVFDLFALIRRFATASLVTVLLLQLTHSFSRRLVNTVDAIGLVNRSFTWLLYRFNPRSRDDEASRCSSFTGNTLLSFLPPIQLSLLTTRVVLVTLASYPYPFCSLSSCQYCCCCCCSSCIMSCRLDTRGFSIRVGLGTKCTQYLFRDHFFRFEYCSEYDCFYSSRCCSSTAISSPLRCSSRLCYCLLSCT